MSSRTIRPVPSYLDVFPTQLSVPGGCISSGPFPRPLLFSFSTYTPLWDSRHPPVLDVTGPEFSRRPRVLSLRVGSRKKVFCYFPVERLMKTDGLTRL